jgi:hypothetical protein
MATSLHIRKSAAAALVLAATFVPLARADGGKAVAPQAIEAYAVARSFAPGDSARIALLGQIAGARASVFRAGYEISDAARRGAMPGAPVKASVRLTGRGASVRIGDWPSGLYFVRFDTPAGHAYAPFVVRPKTLGEHRTAVVLPTNTWAAYNLRDANHDGVGDSWYADPKLSVALNRPFAASGAPPHYGGYDLLFIRWLARSGKDVDFLTDDDLERVASGAQLARAYDLVVFSGHHEYVTTHEYDVTEAYRNRGGNLMFLSANNFFYRVERRGDTLYRTGRWRDLGRPEARLVGIQYLDWNHNEFGNGPYVVRQNGWPFENTGLHAGSKFGTYGIEIDAPTADSPKGLRVLATVPDLFGKGRSAAMTYYATPAGAKVFAAGTINFGGSAGWEPVKTILENIWDKLAQA